MPPSAIILTNKESFQEEATAYLFEEILRQEEKLDVLDRRCMEQKSFVLQRLESKNTVGVVLAMQVYIKHVAERNHAFEQLEDLQYLLEKVEKGEDVGCYQAHVDLILWEAAPECGFGTNMEILERALQLYEQECASRQQLQDDDQLSRTSSSTSKTKGSKSTKSSRSSSKSSSSSKRRSGRKTKQAKQQAAPAPRCSPLHQQAAPRAA